MAVTGRFSGYDLVGDVHGCALSMIDLIEKLGYVKREGVYQYRDRSQPRQLIFVGDILDRGPHIREALLLVREMVERGSARMILGNHEYDALCYETRDERGNYLRAHSARNYRVIEQTLEQFANHAGDWHDALAWFYQLPLTIEEGGFRVVHACWDQPLLERFARDYPSGCLTPASLLASVDERCYQSLVIDRATKGSCLILPDGMYVEAADGNRRRLFRTKFWLRHPKRYGDLVFQPDPLPVAIAQRALPAQALAELPYYGPQQPPLFIGHYWQSGRPRPVTSNIACLDYSAVKGGRLAAYRHQPGQPLLAEHFVWVDGAKA